MELIWTTLGPKFGDDQGKTEMDIRAALLYVNTLGNVCLVLVTNHVLLILNFGLSQNQGTMVLSNTCTSFVMFMTSWLSTTILGLI